MMMRSSDFYNNFSAEQFARDDYFRQWIIEPETSVERFWTAFLHENPGQAEALEQARQLVTAEVYATYAAGPLGTEEKAAMKKDIFDRLRLDEIRTTRTPAPVRRMPWRSIAAAVVILLVAAVCLLMHNPLTKAGNAALLAQHTGPGETRTVLLPDSTTVILNAGSKLEYPADLATAESREVRLEGNAFFSVKKRSQKFVVRTPGLSIAVLGTTFNVNARSAAEEVTLVSGKVKVTGPYQPEKPVVLLPGDRVRLDTAGRTLVASQINAGLYSAWTEGKWSFRQTTLEDIGRLIAAYYNIDVRFNSERSKRLRITAVMPVDSLQRLIPVLEQTLHISMTLSDNRLTIE
jgi:ferric-dicitrate binding protein FerR (iron transport regulator)